WTAGARGGTALSVAAAFIWWFADRIAGTVYSAAWIAVWNSAIRLGFFLIISTLIVRLRTMLDTQQQLARTDLLIGVATCIGAPESADELIRVADEAMYDAKRQGKNRIAHRSIDASNRGV
ncbi:MAG: diguanylate cyclase, partial [Acidimicrobiia bacterium]|nr:diguanylate cyclase [Acidimicrobiia bacterium]